VVEPRPCPAEHPARHRLPAGVTALTAAAAALYMGFALLRYRRFLDTTFDLVIFDQAVRAYAHFHAPVSIARAIADGDSTHFSLLGDHWSPILAVLAPLYWIHDGPTTLVVAQGALFALAIPPLWVFTERLLGPPAAYLTCAAYMLCAPIGAAMTVGFHEVAFVPLLYAVMAERFQAGRRLHGVAAAVALLLVKEDMGLLVAGFGAYLFVTRQRVMGLSFMAGGVVAAWVTTHLLIPAFGGTANFYWAYGQLGSTLPGAAWHVVTHPLQTLKMLVTPRVKLDTTLALLGPLAYLPLASPLVLGAVPLLLERFLATGFPSWWTTGDQYDAFVAMPLFLAAVDGAARVQRRLPRRYMRWPALTPATAWAALVLAGMLVALPWAPLGELMNPALYSVTPGMRAADAAMAMIPDGALVEAANNIGPHLSGRAQVLLLDGAPRWVPWVVADPLDPVFPFCSAKQQAQYVTYLKRNGYAQVFSRAGIVVLHRPADARTREALAHPVKAARLRGDLCGGPPP
jgi:uncharacterized membrane protein